jgi:aspartate carbamoyltransferase catalytic subunit
MSPHAKNAAPASDQLSTDHLLGIADLSAADIELIFRTADGFKEVLDRPMKKVPSLRDITIANLFFENSTRTRISFELAEKRLSADVINFSSSSSSTKKGETLVDTVNNILAMKVDMVVMRHPDPGAAVFLSRHVDARIVNADILHSRVALSNILCLQKLGAEVMLCGPTTLMPKHVDSLGVRVEHDLDRALRWCDVANMLRIQLERQGSDGIANFPSLREYSMLFGLDRERYERIGKDIVIMHPGPINRGVEITSEVADHANSIILEQVENGVAVRMAVLYLLAMRIPRAPQA